MMTDNQATADGIVNEGLTHHHAGRFSDAEAAYRRALSLQPDHPSAIHLLGVLAYQVGKPDAAIELIGRAILLRGDISEFHNSLGNAYLAAKRPADATASIKRAIELRNDFPSAWTNLGTALGACEALEDAVAAHQQAVNLDPTYADAHYNLGNALKSWGKLSASVDAYRRAIELKPDASSFHNNLAIALQAMGDLDSADTHCRRARELDPGAVEPHVISAIVLLMQGRFGEGFDAYEWRWKAPEWPQPPRDFPQTLWNGSSLDGRAIVVWAEQGVGDEIMFSGLIPEIASAADRCLVDCDPRLAPLFERSFPGIETVDKWDPPKAPARSPTLDFQTPAGSLAQWLRRTEQDFPRHDGYLRADPERTREFRKRYGADGDRLVGISWRSGNAMYGEYRSAGLDLWDPVLTISGVRFINLQYGDCAADIAAVVDRLGVDIIADPSVDPLTNLDHFAAQVAAMDLVISIDNSTVHMAGALATPVWVLVPYVADWRWMSGREDSPWYPSLRLIRQPTEGDWRGVMEQAGRDLANFA